MKSKIDINKSISKFLPKIHEFYTKKGNKPSHADYIKHLKKYIGNDIDETSIINGLDEFIGKDGEFIHGDMNFNKRETFVGINNPETSSEFAQQTAQGPRYAWNTQYGNNRTNRNSIAESKMKELIVNILDNSNENIAENKMKKMIEDFMGKRSDDYDIVDKNIEIPGLDKLKYDFSKPIIARKTKNLVEMMDREGVSGEELAIVLNQILSIQNVDIPLNYKNTLISKIKNG